MICEVCNEENPSNSMFCIECGIGFAKELVIQDHKIKSTQDVLDMGERQLKQFVDKDRMVSNQEMKQLLWSIDWDKIPKNDREDVHVGIKDMLKRWRADPDFIPYIPLPMKNNADLKVQEVPKGIPPERMQVFKDSVKNWDVPIELGANKSAVQDFMNALNIKKEEPKLTDEDRLRMQVSLERNDIIDPKKIKEVERMASDIYPYEVDVNETPLGDKLDKYLCLCDNPQYLHSDGIPTNCTNCYWINLEHPDHKQCGVCGTVNCTLGHLPLPPPIQQQYQEAFENIQRIREQRYLRWLNGDRPIFEIMERIYPFLYHEDVFGESPPKSAITGLDVRKGISSGINRPTPMRGTSPITRRNVHKGIGRKSDNEQPNTGLRARPIPFREIQKGLDRPPKKIDPIRDHVISKRKSKFPKFKPDNPRTLR